MALLEINRDPTPRQVSHFGILWLPAFCCMLAIAAYYRGATGPVVVGLAGCGVASILVGLLRPQWTRSLMIAWMWAAFPIGWLVSHLLMVVIYFLVILPIGCLLRIGGRDLLARRLEPDRETYWTERAEAKDLASYFRQF